jgi:hypothetical protein
MTRKTAATPQTAPLSALDRRALERAIEIDRERSAACRAQIDDKLRSEPWLEVAQFAAHRCQEIALHLAPWECWPPAAVAVDVDEPGFAHRGISQSAALLKRMLKAGLSRYEPDPLAAIEAVEARRDGRRQ